MIKKVYKDGKPKDQYVEKEVNKHLNELNRDKLEFVVGIDYAGLSSKDFTAVTHFFKNEDGSLTYAGTKLI